MEIEYILVILVILFTMFIAILGLVVKDTPPDHSNVLDVEELAVGVSEAMPDDHKYWDYQKWWESWIAPAEEEEE